MEPIYILFFVSVMIVFFNTLAKAFAREEYESWDTMYDDVLTLSHIMGYSDRIQEVKHVHGVMEESGAAEREDGELMINMLYYFLAIEVLRDIDPAKYGPELTRQIRWVKTTEIPRVEWKLKVAIQTELQNISEQKLTIHEDLDNNTFTFSLD